MGTPPQVAPLEAAVDALATAAAELDCAAAAAPAPDAGDPAMGPRLDLLAQEVRDVWLRVAAAAMDSGVTIAVQRTP